MNLPNTHAVLKQLTVAKLQPMLSFLGLAKTGLKDTIIKRIVDKLIELRMQQIVNVYSEAVRMLNVELGYRCSNAWRLNASITGNMVVQAPGYAMHAPPTVSQALRFDRAPGQKLAPTNYENIANKKVECTKCMGHDDACMRCTVVPCCNCPRTQHLMCSRIRIEEVVDWICESCSLIVGLDTSTKVIGIKFQSKFHDLTGVPAPALCKFFMGEEEINEIKANLPGKGKIQYQVQMTFSARPYRHQWLRADYFKVNGRLAHLPAVGENVIEFWGNANYWMALFVFKCLELSYEDVVVSIEKQSLDYTYEKAKRNIVQWFKGDDDIETTSMDLSLLCPLSLGRIVQPARGRNCRHVRCFDLNYFLQFNKTKSKWNCPVCSKVVNAASLIIDPYVKKILTDCGDIEDVDEVVVQPDATWLIKESGSNVSVDDGDGPMRKRPRSEEVFAIDDAPWSSGASLSSSQAHVIDLTLEESDDENNNNDSNNINNNNNSNNNSNNNNSSSNNSNDEAFTYIPPPVYAPEATESHELVLMGEGGLDGSSDFPHVNRSQESEKDDDEEEEEHSAYYWGGGPSRYYVDSHEEDYEDY